MTGEEFVLSIVAMVMGSGVLIVGIAKITDLIKTWISRGESHFTDEEFGRLAKAFMQHKKDMEKRVQNIEAIIADKDEQDNFPQIEESKTEGSLTNDLQRKGKVRS